MVSVNSDIIIGLLDVLSEKELAEFSYQKGSLRVKENLLQRGMTIDYDNVLWYISQILGEGYGWFRYDYNGDGFVDNLHLSHRYGYRWSVFIDNWVRSILNDVLGIKVNTGISSNAVNFEIRKKK